MTLGVCKALLTILTLRHSSLSPQRPVVFPKHPQTFISLLTCCSLFCHLILSIFPSQLGLDCSWKVAFFAASPAHILFTSTQNPYLAKRCFFFRCSTLPPESMRSNRGPRHVLGWLDFKTAMLSVTAITKLFTAFP